VLLGRRHNKAEDDGLLDQDLKPFLPLLELGYPSLLTRARTSARAPLPISSSTRESITPRILVFLPLAPLAYSEGGVLPASRSDLLHENSSFLLASRPSEVNIRLEEGQQRGVDLVPAHQVQNLAVTAKALR